MPNNTLIFGDSYSTFKGYIPEGYATWYPDNDRYDPDVQVYEITGPMFFGATDKFADILKDAKKEHKVMILRMRSVPALDATAYQTLEKIYNSCVKRNITLIISHINDQPLNVLKKQELYEKIGEENFVSNIYDAIERAKNITE